METPILDMIFSTPLPSALIRLRSALSRGRRRPSTPARGQVLDGLERQVRVDRGGAVADQQRDVVAPRGRRRTRRPGRPGSGSSPGSGGGAPRRSAAATGSGSAVARRRQSPVGQHDDAGRRRDRRRAPRRRSRPAGRAAPAPPPATGSNRPSTTWAAKPGRSPSSLMCTILARSSLPITGNGSTIWRQDAGAGSSRFCSGPMVRGQRGDQLLADGVQRRVGDLGEQLGEVVEEQPRPVRQHRHRGVGAHRADRLGAGAGHRARG